MRRRIKHDLLILILVAIIATFAVLAAVAWLIAHVLILAGVALLIGAAYHLGRHMQRRARPAISPRPGQARPKEPAGRPVASLPAAASAGPAVTLPQADYDWDETAGRQQPARRQAGPDRNTLLATPMSGVRPLRGPE
jgi:hypothetical protein